MQLIDSHCHIDFDRFDEDRAAVLNRASTAGVRLLINPSTDLANSEQVVQTAQQFQAVYAAVGVHPYDADQIDETGLSRLSTLAAAPKVVAIGEIGLDYYRDITPKVVQRQAFEAQLTLAAALNLPVIIHQREAAADTMAILRQWATKGHPGVVLHAFQGDKALVDAAAELDFYFGIGGPVTFKNARGFPNVVAGIPRHLLLIETDAPFLSPHPFRGKRNEPARVALVLHKLAEIFETDPIALSAQIIKNTTRLFNRLPSIA